MNVADMISYLEQYDDDTEVMVAYQPSWPLAVTVENVTTLDEATDGNVDPDERDRDVVWVVAGSAHHSMSPYAPRDLFSSF